MAACNDCLNRDVCTLNRAAHIVSNEFAHKMEEYCQFFKASSRFIKLPCELNATLYRIVFVNGGSTVKTTSLNKNTFWRIVIEGEFGKTVFLTREEAEHELQKRNSEVKDD